MKKWIMFFFRACLLALIAGCSQTSQAAGQSEQPKSSHQPINQMKQQNNQQSKRAINGFDWQVFTKKQTDPSKQMAPTAETVNGIVPVTIKIPAINVDTDVIAKGLVKSGPYKGHMATPDNAVQVAWYKLGAKPGEKGSAIIAGHVDTYKGPGVFFNLKDLKDGDLVYISGKNGKTLTFKVFDKQAYPRENAPIYKVFGYTAARVVRLLTCTGNFDYSADTHNERLVVSAVLVQKKDSIS